MLQGKEGRLYVYVNNSTIEPMQIDLHTCRSSHDTINHTNIHADFLIFVFRRNSGQERLLEAAYSLISSSQDPSIPDRLLRAFSRA